MRILKENVVSVNDFFCGAGGMGLGFKYAGFRLSGAWDFDKWAVESYGNNVSPKVKQMDISQMTGDEVPYADVWTFGFPCQDISVAGKQAGMIKGETRSGLFYEVMRLLDEVEYKPKVILAENVKAVKKYLPEIEKEYSEHGYKMYYTLYNSKYWGVPQNRERYFMIGVHESIDKEFIFPTQQTDFVPKLSSILEDEVDEKFYISDEKALKIIEQAKEGLRVKQATKKGYDVAVEGDSINLSHPNSKTRRGRVGKQVAQTLLTGQEQVVVESLNGVHACITPDRVNKRQNGRRAKDNEEEMYTLTSQDLHGVIIDDTFGFYKDNPRVLDISPTSRAGRSGLKTIEQEPKIDVIGMLDMKGHETIRRVYDKEGLSPTLTTSQGGNTQPKVLIGDKVETEPHLKSVGNTSNTGFNKSNVYDVEGISPTVAARDYKGPNQILEKEPSFRVRKLTPREYARLQGFPDSYEQVVSNSQFYKQMGNAVTVNVAQAIAEQIKEFLLNNN